MDTLVPTLYPPTQEANNEIVDLISNINVRAAVGHLNQTGSLELITEIIVWYYYVGGGFIVKVRGISQIKPL